MPAHSIARLRPGAIPVTNVFQAGAAAVDVTPHPGLPLAGYSVGGPRAEGARGRLYARATVFDDGVGGRVALVVCDLHSGARYVNEKAASLVAETHGLSVDRLVVFGTHTHTGHGGFYGDSFYDRMSADGGDFDRNIADWTAERVAAAVRDACGALRPARLRTATVPVPAAVRNRAIKATRANPEWPSPSTLTPHQAIDDRLTAWVALPKDPLHPLIVFALFGCHATALGAHEDRFEPDWPGRAVRAAVRELTAGGGAWTGASVALSNGCAGDVTPLGFQGLPQSPALADAVGARLGAAIVEAVVAAEGVADDPAPRVASRFEEAPWSGPQSLFAERWAAGHSIIGGAEDGRSSFFTAAMGEGLPTPAVASQYKSDPRQIPKTPILDSKFLADAATGFLLLHPPHVLTLRILTLGRSTLVALPFEPTVIAGRRVELATSKAIKDAEGAASPRAECVRVAGYAGAFNGYLTTPEEYDVQLYEGAHTLWGRESQPEVALRCARLATTNPVAAEGAGEFPDVFHPNPQFLFEGPTPKEKATWTDRRAEEDAGFVVARFMVVQMRSPVFAGGPWAIVERRPSPDAEWAPAAIDGLSCDDASGFASIGDRTRLPPDPDGFDRFRYQYEFRAPAAPLRRLGGELRLRLMFESGPRRAIPVRL
jgi:neutral ceramidase